MLFRSYINGKQKVISSGTTNLEEAIPILEKWFDDLQVKKGENNDENKEISPENLNQPDLSSKPGIFSAPCSLELYAEIFEQENALNNLEIFSSINGAKFYNFPINNLKIKLEKKDWVIPEFSTYKDIQVKNFYANKKINWKIID